MHLTRSLSHLAWLLLFWSACANKPPADITDPGQLLYLGYGNKEVNCARCHGPEGQGGMQAPDIRNVFSKYDDDTVLDIIELGKGEGSKKMPPYEGKITEEELQELLRFLKTLSSVPADHPQ
ncbi:MAG: c-type cytochrome [bacterium]